jgi:hypothetical protein
MLRVLFYILYLIFFLISCYVFSINCHNIYYHYSIISNHSEDQAAFSSKQVSFHPLILTHFTHFCRPHNFPHSSHITSLTSCRRRHRRDSVRVAMEAIILLLYLEQRAHTQNRHLTLLCCPGPRIPIPD